MTATKIQPGDDTHLTLLMAPHSLNFVTGADRAALLAYGRDVFAAALKHPSEAALQTLRDYAEGRIEHDNAGCCPDSIEGPGQRDSECRVCQALDAFAGAVPASLEPGALLPRLRSAYDACIVSMRAAGSDTDARQRQLLISQALSDSISAEQARLSAGAAPAAVAHLPAVLEQIAQGWDGCKYDAPGETLDIGADIRAAAKRLLAEQPAATWGEQQVHALAIHMAASAPPSHKPRDYDADMAWARSALGFIAGHAPAAPALEAPAAPAGDEEAAFTKWFQGEQGKPYQGMWEFARAAWMSRAATAAAPQAPAAPACAAVTDEQIDAILDSPGGLGMLIADPRQRLRLFARRVLDLAAPAAPAVDATSDTALLDAMQRHRIALVPEFEGPWDAEIYDDDAEARHIASGNTPREALRAAIAAQAKEGGGT